MLKVHAKGLLKTKSNSRFQGKRKRGHTEGNQISSKRTASRPMARLELSSTGGETKENYAPKKGLLGENLTPAAHVGNCGQATW